MRNLSCVVTALVKDVLPASTSSVPTSLPCSNRHSRIAWAARPTTHAKSIGSTLGPYKSISVRTTIVFQPDHTNLLALMSALVTCGWSAVSAWAYDRTVSAKAKKATEAANSRMSSIISPTTTPMDDCMRRGSVGQPRGSSVFSSRRAGFEDARAACFSEGWSVVSEEPSPTSSCSEEDSISGKGASSPAWSRSAIVQIERKGSVLKASKRYLEVRTQPADQSVSATSCAAQCMHHAASSHPTA